VLGSILTRQYRFATRAFGLTLRTGQQAIDIAGGIVGDVAGRLGLHNGHDEPDVVSGEVAPEPEPVASPPPATSAPARPAAQAPARPATQPPARPAAQPPARPAAQAPARAVAPAPPPEPPAPASDPAHVSAEPELVEEFAEPGAEDGAGAQIRIGEPWPGYRHLKARDVIARLSQATREELAAVELFELAGANRRSVVVAAQRALKRASPPR
jgi:hypothetical protein